MNNQPLYLPKGSVRAIIILIMTSSIMAMIAFQIKIPEVITTIWAGAIGWYFANKKDNLKN